MDTIIEVWVDGDTVSLDRNYRPITEGQRSVVVLRFHFDDSWNDRNIKIISLLNRNQVYTQPMHQDVVRVPKFLINEGCLKFIVRGFLTMSGGSGRFYLKNNGHFVVTDASSVTGEPAYAYLARPRNYVVSDVELDYRQVQIGKKSNDHLVLTDDMLYKEIHDIPPITEDRVNGYMEACLIGDEVIRIGRKRM